MHVNILLDDTALSSVYICPQFINYLLLYHVAQLLVIINYCLINLFFWNEII